MKKQIVRMCAVGLLLLGAGPGGCEKQPVYFLRCSGPGIAPYFAEVKDSPGLDPARVEPYKDVLIGYDTTTDGLRCSITDSEPSVK